MSSNSLAVETIGGFLSESFAILCEEMPPAYARMCARMGSRRVEIRVERECFTVECDQDGARIGDATGAPDARITTSRGSILDVIDARRTLSEAVLADELAVVGSLEVLVELHDALVSYLHGAVRSPSFPSLLERLRASEGGRHG